MFLVIGILLVLYSTLRMKSKDQIIDRRAVKAVLYGGIVLFSYGLIDAFYL